jgi:hypothetical protein
MCKKFALAQRKRRDEWKKREPAKTATEEAELKRRVPQGGLAAKASKQSRQAGKASKASTTAAGLQSSIAAQTQALRGGNSRQQ